MLLKSILICGYPPAITITVPTPFSSRVTSLRLCRINISMGQPRPSEAVFSILKRIHSTQWQMALFRTTSRNYCYFGWHLPGWGPKKQKKKMKRKINMSYRVNTNSTYTASVQHVSSRCIASDCIPELLCSNVDINHETHSEGSIFDFRPHDRLAWQSFHFFLFFPFFFFFPFFLPGTCCNSISKLSLIQCTAYSVLNMSLDRHQVRNKPDTPQFSKDFSCLSIRKTT